MLIDEDRVAGGAVSSRLVDLFREKTKRLIPLDRLELAAAPNHRTTEAIGIVQPLKRSLSARAQRALVHWMIRISLELDGASVARLRDDAAPGRTLSARRRVISRDSGNRLIRRNEIRYQLLDFLLRASEHRGSRA